MPESKFTPAQAEELAAAFAREGVDYLFIGKSGAILLGYPETTQDVDIFLPQSPENAERVLRALRTLGFKLDPALTVSILAGSEIVLLKGRTLCLGFDSRAGWHRELRGRQEPLRAGRRPFSGGLARRYNSEQTCHRTGEGYLRCAPARAVQDRIPPAAVSEVIRDACGRHARCDFLPRRSLASGVIYDG